MERKSFYELLRRLNAACSYVHDVVVSRDGGRGDDDDDDGDDEMNE